MKTEPGARAADPIALAFLAIAALCAVMAYVGLSASGYWIDELFSLFILDHGGGQAEVLRRALTDTHPPLFYFLAYPWTQLFGTSETGARSLSATLLVASLPLLFVILRRIYSLRAAAFGVAVAASSKLFFEQTHNVRNYPLAVLLSTGLLGLTLALRRRAAAGGPIPVWLASAFWLVALGGSFTHLYLFLTVGAAHFYLLLTMRTLRQRAAVAASGVSILVPVAAFVSVLTHGSQQDVEDMWFSNSFDVLSKQMLNGLSQAWSWAVIGAIVVLAAVVLARQFRRASVAVDANGERKAAAQLATLAILGVIGAGLAISFLVAPSFGARNLVVLAPFFWLAAAGLYDAAAPDPRGASGKVLIGLLLFFLLGNVANLRGRFLVRAEAWRESAALVAATSGCETAVIPAVLPDLFGPSTPFFHELARTHFYGRYFPRERLSIITPDAFSPATADPQVTALWRSRLTGGCRVLAWAVHDVDLKRANTLADQMARTAGVPRDRIAIRTVETEKMWLAGISKSKPTAFIFERAAP